MREFVINASLWKSRDDVFLSFFKAVGAPSWHGRNFNAIRDSIGGGQINAIEVPYRIVLQNYASVDPAVKENAALFVDVIEQLASEGVPVEIRVETSC